MNFTRMKPAKPRPSRAAKPRHRATMITAGAKATAMTINGMLRSKSENWYCAGCPSMGGIRIRVTRCPTSVPLE